MESLVRGEHDVPTIILGSRLESIKAIRASNYLSLACREWKTSLLSLTLPLSGRQGHEVAQQRVGGGLSTRRACYAAMCRGANVNRKGDLPDPQDKRCGFLGPQLWLSAAWNPAQN
jgi:hypothetical protein